MSYNQNATLTGLTSYSITAPTTGAYFIEGKISLPTVTAGGGQSSCVATITNDTTPATLYTGTAGADGFYLDLNATAGDVITVALTSAADADQPKNVIKATIQFGSAQ